MSHTLDRCEHDEVKWCPRVTVEKYMTQPGTLTPRRTPRPTFEDLRSYWPRQSGDVTGIRRLLHHDRPGVAELHRPAWCTRPGGPCAEGAAWSGHRGHRQHHAVPALMEAGLVDEYRPRPPHMPGRKRKAPMGASYSTGSGEPSAVGTEPHRTSCTVRFPFSTSYPATASHQQQQQGSRSHRGRGSSQGIAGARSSEDWRGGRSLT